MSAAMKLDPQTYLEHERASEEKHEYVAGEVFAMSGASPAHNLIVSNLIRELGNQFRKRPCRVYPSDLRVQLADAYVYPDVTVVCGKPEFSEGDNLLNPSLLIEVLSPSTADYDAGSKFARYRQLSSLQDYVLVAQDKHSVVHYCRQDANHWLLTELNCEQDVIELGHLQCQLNLEDIYEKVFEEL